MRIYAIGDIHGCIDLLDKLLARIHEDATRRPTEKLLYVFLGDYIDRGAWSRQTIDRLLEHSAANDTVFLRGNHELIAIDSLSDLDLFEKWLRFGGPETLISYGISPEIAASSKKMSGLQAAFQKAFPPSHLRFFLNLQNSFECGDFFFVHAGVRPNVALSAQTEADLLWIRDEFLSSTEDFGQIVVHGHTPTGDVEVRPNRINIDTGAYATGRLTCLVVDDSSLSIIDTL
jgi:serine/threonine protein phosphatase 1